MSSTQSHDQQEKLSARAWGTLLVLCGALFLDALDVSMKGVALPSIGAELHMSTSSLQWVVSGYVLGFGGFLLLGGRAADLLGRRRVFTGSLAVFLVASAVGGFATDGTVLVIARFITGLSAAFTAPAGLSIITTGFAEGPARNRAIAIFNATGASGFALGLVVGGLMTDISWRWVFFLPVVMGLATLAGALALVPRDDRKARSGGFDVPGAITVTAAMLALVFALVQAPEWGWAAPATLGLFGATAALLAVFVVIERRTATPLLRLRVLRSGAVIRANLGGIALLGGWISYLFICTLYLQEVRGWSALQTGLAVAPSGLLVAVLAPRVAAPLVGRFGVTPVITAGLAAGVAAYALMLPLGPDTGYALGMLPTFLLVGIAFTLGYGPLTIAATTGVPAAEQGVAAGLINTSFQLGPALALAGVTAVLHDAASAGASQVDSLRTAVIVPLAGAVIGLAATLPGLRRSR